MATMTEPTRAAVFQARMDELAGKYAHQKLVRFPRVSTRLAEILCIAIPIAYYAPKSMVDKYLGGEGAAAILAVILLLISIIRQVSRWDDNLVSHRVLMAKAHRAANRALEILNDPNVTEEEAQEFLRSSADQSIEEIALFEQITPKIKQYAYREALKQIIPSKIDHAICANCSNSVWNFKKGNCQLCGGNG
jgi:mobilome CxxCx(11)CxxC protein